MTFQAAKGDEGEGSSVQVMRRVVRSHGSGTKEFIKNLGVSLMTTG